MIDEFIVNAALGMASTQSSYWAGLGERATLTNGDFQQDMGCHTLLDENPWWCLDFLHRVPIHAIRIHNRRDGFQERARTLTVEASGDGENWITLHSGEVHFGAVGAGEPFVVPCGGKVVVRFVRLSLREREHLHLSQIEVLADRRDIALVKLREKLGFSIATRFEATANPAVAYELTCRDDQFEADLIGLELFENGAFGNCMIQYSIAFQIAKRLGLKYIKIAERDRSQLITLEHALEIDGVTLLPAGKGLPGGGVFLRGNFFDATVFGRVFDGVSAEDRHIAVTTFVRRVFNVLPERFERKPEKSLYVHIRSGDIFRHWVNPDYIQPPLGYYVRIVDFLFDAGKIDRVELVFEDWSNPVIDRLIAYLAGKGVAFGIHSGSLVSDISTLASARYLVFGLGSFGPAICQLSEGVDTVFFYSPGIDPGFRSVPTVARVIEGSDKDGRYMKVGEWRNSPEQRLAMVDYPAESIAFSPSLESWRDQERP